MFKIKLKNNRFLDSNYIVHGRKKLSKILDKLDFKEGTWEPTIVGATVEYTQRIGHYKKIGSIVFFTFGIRGKITSVEQERYSTISGLPFTSIYQGGTGSLTEYAFCLEHTLNAPATLSVGQILTIKRSDQWGGTTADEWKVCDGFYLQGGGFYFTND